MSGEHEQSDPLARAPNPPFGYCRECEHSEEQQIRIVAEFHANRIKPSRIAYRTGIDIRFVRQLLDGELHQQHFKHLLALFRRQRRSQRLQSSLQLSGYERFERQKQIEQEYQATRELPEPKPRIIKTLHRR